MSQPRDRTWTIRELMQVAIDHLNQKTIPEARLTVELLLAHALALPRISLYTSYDRPLNRDEVSAFRTLFERRLQREPLQYIIGTAHFMGLQFQVDPRVLIPRPETELIIEQMMLRSNRPDAEKEVKILDVGTGSGNIAISLAKFIKRSFIVSIDISEAALEVARYNAAQHLVVDRIDFRNASIFDDVRAESSGPFDFLVSNPPYIARNEWNELQPEVREHEPRTALTDEGDGLKYYRRIAEVAPTLLAEGGTVLVEIGFGQAAAVKALFEAAGLAEIDVINDLAGIPRVVAGRSTLRRQSN